MVAFADAIRERERAAYLADERAWRYWDLTERLNEPGHAATQAEWMVVVDPSLGAAAVDQILESVTDDPDVVIAHARVLPLRCEHADAAAARRFGEALDAVDDERTLAKAALWAARVAVSC